MAVNDNMRDNMSDNLRGGDPERDPKLAQWLAAASREEPPAALDAAILAAARREVNARPQALGGARPQVVGSGSGGEAGAPPVRAKRNWYVPVSIAAVMVLSVSLVSIVRHEKGDELTQPPAATRSLPKAPAAAEVPAPVARAEKQDGTLRDAVSPKLAEENPGEPAKATGENPSPDGFAALAQKPRGGKFAAAPAPAIASNSARKDQPDTGIARQQGPSDSARETKSAVATIQGQMAAGAAAPAVAERAPLEMRREAEAVRPAPERARAGAASPGVRGFDGASVGATASAPASAPPAAEARPAPAPPPEPFPAQSPASRDDAAGRGDADRNATASAKAAPAIAAAPVAPPPPAAKLAVRPAPKPAVRSAPQRLPVWRGLEDQPAEKWLERLAEFRRDSHQADADELLAEFRRRFPDHPAGAR